MKHTPEPWEKIEDWVKKGGEKVALVYGIDNTQEHANAARIVACVNACAGMDDPAAEIERLRAIESDMPEVLRLVKMTMLEDLLNELRGLKPEQYIEAIEERIQFLKENNP
jgi:hypothetical protein